MNQNITVQVWHNRAKYLLTPILAMMLMSSNALADNATADKMYSESVTNTPSQQKQRTVKGRITDDKGEPVIGATIVLKGTSTGDLSDVDGNYSLRFTANNPILVFSYLGLETVELPVGASNDLDVVMKESTVKIEQVTVVGYGTQRKESVIGAISTVNLNDISMPVAKLSSALGGKLAGVVTVQASGEPGAGAEFWIRGISTFGANKTPLVLVDGVERTLDLVDTEDIATFSILKDASATAVYGVRGANGVIIIQTKKGSEGRPSISVKYEHGLLTPMKMPKLADSYEFASLYNEAMGYDYYDANAMAQYKMGNNAIGRDNNLYPNVDWLNELFEDVAQNQRVNVAVSGGGAVARYYIAGSYYNEGSIFRQNQATNGYNSSIRYQKVNFRANVDVNLTPTTELSVKIANIFETKNEPGGGKGNIWSYGFITSPNAFPTFYTDDQTGAWKAWSGPSSGSGMNPYNVLMNSGYKEIFTNSTQSAVGLTQTFGNAIPGLSAKINFAWDAWNFTDVTRAKTVTQYIAQGRDENGELLLQESVKGGNTLGYETGRGEYTQNGTSTYLEAMLNYDKTFGDDHRFSALFLYNQKIKTFVGVPAKEGGAKYLSLPYKNQGLAARVAYSYGNRYFAEVNVGYNGSENFSPGKRFGLFPAVALGWIMTNEKFMEPVSRAISLVKIRGSYGIVGNDQIGGSRRFIYNPTVNEGAPGYGGMGENGDYNPGGIADGEFANANVGWEEAKKLNIGVELGFMNNALKITADYFKEDRSGIFMLRAGLQNTTGISSTPYVNVGKMKNGGFDGTIEYMQRVGEVDIQARGNFTYARNMILDNDEPDWKYKYQNKIGKPSGQVFGHIAEGLFKDQADIDASAYQTYGNVRPGDIKYRDINGDGKIDASDQIAIGFPSMPEIMYGFGANASWKGLTLGIFFQGITNSNIFLSGRSLRPFAAGNVQQSSFNQDVYEGIWREGNPDVNARYPRMSLSNNPNNNAQSTYWMRDRSYLRLKEVNLSYRLPQRWMQAIHLKGAEVYAQGMNLWTISGFKLWDPENGGGEGAAYPLSTTISLGIRVTY